MPKARIAMNKIREILRLHESQLSNRMISRALKVSRPVVAEYISQAAAAGLTWEEVQQLTDEQVIQQLQRRPAAHDQGPHKEFFEQLPKICRELGKKHTTRQLLWEEYRETNPQGYSYTQFCYHIQQYLQNSDLSMHLSYEPGRLLFVDYAGDKPCIYDRKTGLKQLVELFVANLPCSGLIYTEVQESQKLEDFIAGTQHSLIYFGGSTAIITPDNLRSAVKDSDLYEPDVNETFWHFGQHYGCVVVPARPRKPKDKALCESSVRLVYTRIIAPLRHQKFYSIDDFNEAIWEKLEELNNRTMKNINISRRQRFIDLEQRHLASLPAHQYILHRFITDVSVQKNYHVYFKPDKHFYSVPYKYRNTKVRIAYTRTTVELYQKNMRIAVHRRTYRAYDYTTVNGHMPSQHRIYAEWTPQRFINWAEKVGIETKLLIERVIADRPVPEQAFKTCLGILNLEKKFTAQRLEAACKRANFYQLHSYKSLKRILDKQLDQAADLTEDRPAASFHENLRGGSYYGAQEETHE